MALANYTDLQASVANWLHRSDLTAQIPDFIALAETQLARDLRIAPLIANINVIVPANGTSAILPTGCMEVVSARIQGGNTIRYVTPDAYDRALINANGVAVPLCYTMIGTSIFVAPQWAVGGALTLNYFKKETALSGTNLTNWYITNAPDMLLYAALLKATPYLKNAADAQVWAQFYQQARDRLNDQFGVLDSYQRMAALNSSSGKALSPSV